MVATVKNRAAWLGAHIAMAAIGTFLASLVFNYGWRFMVDRHAGSPQFYVATFGLGFATYALFRRDYLFVDRFDLTAETFAVHTAFGATRIFNTSTYNVVPSLHKTVSVPARKASLSFSLVHKQSGRRARNYAWFGFSREDFIAASRLYGYSGNDDFSLREV
jgi:hypothetical protein